jgi:hypothetical protein
LIKLVIGRHHHHGRAPERRGEPAQDLGIVVLGVDHPHRFGRHQRARDRGRRGEGGEARWIGGGLAPIAERDAEADRREERRGESADVPGADHQHVDERIERLEEDLDRAAAAHAERGAEAEGLHPGDGAGVAQRLEHPVEHDALDRAAADGAHRGAIVEERQLLPGRGGRRPVPRDDRGQHDLGAPIERVERRAEDLVRRRGARQDGRGVAHARERSRE